MRRLCVLLALSALALSAALAVSTAPAAEPRSVLVTPAAFSKCGCNNGASDESASSGTEDSASTGGDNNSDDGGCNHCGHGGCRGRRNENSNFNCNCHGSYKFPVPPLYTYHWPGLYSMQRMTDYHSPWRFPAIKPYQDETPVRDLSSHPTDVRQASAQTPGEEPPHPSLEEPLSAKIGRHYADSQQ